MTLCWLYIYEGIAVLQETVKSIINIELLIESINFGM